MVTAFIESEMTQLYCQTYNFTISRSKLYSRVYSRCDFCLQLKEPPLLALLSLQNYWGLRISKIYCSLSPYNLQSTFNYSNTFRYDTIIQSSDLLTPFSWMRPRYAFSHISNLSNFKDIFRIHRCLWYNIWLSSSNCFVPQFFIHFQVSFDDEVFSISSFESPPWQYWTMQRAGIASIHTVCLLFRHPESMAGFRTYHPFEPCCLASQGQLSGVLLNSPIIRLM